MQIHRLLISGTGRTFIQHTKGEDVTTQYGTIHAKDIDNATEGSTVKSNKGETLTIIKPSWIDKYKKIRRGAQIITLKDAGIILATTGIGPESIVAEAGSGSGALTAFLARHCKKVYSYDINTEHQENAKHNIKELGFTNVTFKTHDITTGIPDGPIDCLILDMPEPWHTLAHKDNLRLGAYIVTYTPSTVQLQTVHQTATKEGLLHVRTVEVTERHWTAKRDAVRPTSRNTAFTAFLSFWRYLGPEWPDTRPKEAQGTPGWTLPEEGMEELF